MKSKRIKINLVGNNNLSKEEEGAIWASFFDLMNMKKLRDETSKNLEIGSVGSEDKLTK